MAKLALLTLLMLCLVPIARAQTPSVTLDSNAAFYQGEELNYIFYPPRGFRMVDDEAVQDGYSFAFVPSEADYDTTDILIGVNIFKIRGMTFAEALKIDTTSVRKHYGPDATILPVESIYTGSGQPITTFYINNLSTFLPNVMMSYFDGGSEMLIFELVITDRVLKFEAEKTYISCLEHFKALPVGELGSR
ncbi:MAG: hypothetical protein KKA42_05830 [candidate division Zixibacteria bacterium]|nr:hypothetical protein [candidate division Zixibacteria bacterium]